MDKHDAIHKIRSTRHITLSSEEDRAMATVNTYGNSNKNFVKSGHVVFETRQWTDGHTGTVSAHCNTFHLHWGRSNNCTYIPPAKWSLHHVTAMTSVNTFKFPSMLISSPVQSSLLQSISQQCCQRPCYKSSSQSFSYTNAGSGTLYKIHSIGGKVHHTVDWVKVLRPIRHKIGHFGDVPQANVLAWYGKTKPNITKARIQQSKQMLVS